MSTLEARTEPFTCTCGSIKLKSLKKHGVGAAPSGFWSHSVVKTVNIMLPRPPPVG